MKLKWATRLGILGAIAALITSLGLVPGGTSVGSPGWQFAYYFNSLSHMIIKPILSLWLGSREMVTPLEALLYQLALVGLTGAQWFLVGLAADWLSQRKRANLTPDPNSSEQDANGK